MILYKSIFVRGTFICYQNTRHMAELTSLGIVAVLCVVASASCSLPSHLNVKFGAFNKLPTTREEAERRGWRNISGEDCSNNGQFEGYRYTNNSDNSLSILFDRRGALAGLQMNMVVEELLAGGNNFHFDLVKMYQKNTIEGIHYYTFTAYFQRPGDICSTGENACGHTNKGNGTDLFFQDGVNNYIEAPKNRTDALKLPIWTNNNCFPGMGYHNKYSVQTWADDNCLSIKPIFLLYDINGLLHGFGFDAMGTVRGTNFEIPAFVNIQKIMGDSLPACVENIFNTVGITSMHVYFIDNPQDILC